MSRRFGDVHAWLFSEEKRAAVAAPVPTKTETVEEWLAKGNRITVVSQPVFSSGAEWCVPRLDEFPIVEFRWAAKLAWRSSLP